jgi:hypothetical protein
MQMATLQQKIAERFLAKLAASRHMDAAKIEQLRSLLENSKKPQGRALRADFLPSGRR